METISERVSQKYREYQQGLNFPPLSKKFGTKKYNEEKFKELAKDAKAKKIFHKTTVGEARTAIHDENAQRIEQPICKLLKSTDLPHLHLSMLNTKWVAK